jgi:hypothetical protein
MTRSIALSFSGAVQEEIITKKKIKGEHDALLFLIRTNSTISEHHSSRRRGSWEMKRLLRGWGFKQGWTDNSLFRFV